MHTVYDRCTRVTIKYGHEMFFWKNRGTSQKMTVNESNAMSYLSHERVGQTWDKLGQKRYEEKDNKVSQTEKSQRLYQIGEPSLSARDAV